MSTHPVRIGISGWRYRPWRGVFYPPGLVQRRELEHASRQLSTIEINGSFYSLQRPASYQRWAAQTPADFVFSVKGPRFITHMLRLRGARVPLANFFASGVLALGDKLGPVLWQLPERHAYDADQLAEFFALLPQTTQAALALAADHDSKVADRTWLGPVHDRPLRHVLEVRSTSFADNQEFVDLLRHHGIGLVVADTAGRWPSLDAVTSGVVYVRLHGDTDLYVSGYTDAALATWAERIRGWSSTADVYVSFDNDVKVHAPFDAIRLARMLGADVGTAPNVIDLAERHPRLLQLGPHPPPPSPTRR
ncbi:MAG: DUF72 domain-containing protein [Ornithinimicrobium sp.]|uniref:DUF72 domain-containing protein n=1 Tax=Ornithinimicrobium sp. TaxID=1977084 RepID=UPI0026DF3C4A|nr:DUF72 domain-containing protein [Ornithinimicrobium sp.]MDO5738735.1 DUF72 domain-containing protein [Ornithinimicrobium sp.]